tara:strand:- start:487 stop:1167 length:681 start_codon:yes stop_codon:yes gene_type:complete
MVNSWSLLYSELNGTMDEDYPIMYGPEDEQAVVDAKKKNTDKSDYYFDYDRNGDMPNPFSTLSDNDDQIAHHVDAGSSTDTLNFGTPIPGGMGEDHISFSVSGVDPVYAYHYPGTEKKPEPNLKDGSTQKYQEDKGIADLKSYVASTYQGHYTNKNSSVQTLDLIHSVGDAESFCRSNAIKYLSRYDKKGSAKNDILKAMHYCLLLYYFSGNTQEPTYTNTRYETF